MKFSHTRTRFLTANAQGPREEQQDAAICLQSNEHRTGLIVVSDGVGGKSGGRLASQKVTELAEQLWAERGGQLSDPAEELQTLCRVAHEHINDEGLKNGISPRTTIVALYLTRTHAHWVHSGDSRLYHFRAGQLVARTGDHSLLELMVERGIVKEEDMGTHPDQGTLLQSLGGEEYMAPSSGEAEITPEDAFLLCTDGFWERTPVEEMAPLLFTSRAKAPELIAQAVERAVQRNGSKGDNVTMAVALPAREMILFAGHSVPATPLLVGLGGGSLALLVVAALLWFPWGKKPTTPEVLPAVTPAMPPSPKPAMPRSAEPVMRPSAEPAMPRSAEPVMPPSPKPAMPPSDVSAPPSTLPVDGPVVAPKIEPSNQQPEEGPPPPKKDFVAAPSKASRAGRGKVRETPQATPKRTRSLFQPFFNGDKAATQSDPAPADPAPAAPL